MTELGAKPAAAGRVLVAGDSSVLAVLPGLFESLPDSARGQVFIEVESSRDITLVDCPERFTVTWLVREIRSGAPGSGRACSQGEALERAVRAWVGEMTTGDREADSAELCVWLGGCPETIDSVCTDVAERLGSRRQTLARQN